MDKATRSNIQRVTQAARGLLENTFRKQLEGTYDILLDGTVAAGPGAHLSDTERVIREKLVAALAHKRASGLKPEEAVVTYLREAAFTTLNRFFALKMLEVRDLLQECVSEGEDSSGFKEFTALAPGLASLSDKGYRLYIETLFDEIGQEVNVLFDRHDVTSLLWPDRQALLDLLSIVNDGELSSVWAQDETIGWVYQYFNGEDERRKMREESQAPRNSRELAVRNQFFTPRYVVQFLTDNTLGRTWLDMYGDGSRLAELCEYFVHPVEEPVRPRLKKDPRDLRVLDPACGSGHFLLYSFDLLLTIYEEAWTGEAYSVPSELTGRTLREDYPDLAALQTSLPVLILERNLYGVDIDPRCAQIAALALWMRAQRAFKDYGIAASRRPAIRETHIVVAESMPGDAALVEEFAGQLEPPLLGELFRKMVIEMRLASELGTLLRVEDGIATELARAREQFLKQRETSGFLPGLEPLRRREELDLSGIDDERFFHEAEERIVEALRGFAETAAGGTNVRRRLFADDAVHGIALIDLVRTRFDVVLMNPPFGASSLPAKTALQRSYPRTKHDLYAAFVERGIQLLSPGGLLGAITSRTGFFLSSFQKWREEILLKEAPPVVFADLGYGVMDSAMVEAAAYCLEKSWGVRSVKTIFLRALEETGDKEVALRAAVRDPKATKIGQRFEVDSNSFRAVPRSPFAYWVSERLRRLFAELGPLERTFLVASGTGTLDDFRFLRVWWELTAALREPTDGGWPVYAKGGRHSPFYFDHHLRVNWACNGAQMKAWIVTRYGGGHWARNIRSTEHYFRPGITWPRRTKSELSMRVLPSGCIFADKGPGLFVRDEDQRKLLALLAVGASGSFQSLVALQLAAADARAGGAARSYEVGVIQRTPIPNLTSADEENLAALARRAWSLKHSLDTHAETSHAFILPNLLQGGDCALDVRADAWAERVHKTEEELAAIQAEIDDRCFDLYGIGDADRQVITEGFGDSEPAEANDQSGVQGTDDAPRLAAELVSWAVGVALGRFDVRLATGERAGPPEPEPFDPLPLCSPGMLTGDDGLPLTSAPAGYPLVLSESGILADDPGHRDDIGAAVRSVFDVVFGERSDARWHEATELLDPKTHDLRTWLATKFFEHHLKHYSKSRRKAPILWQLGTPASRYSVWLYTHRLNRDSFFRLQDDVVAPKLAHEERQLLSLIQTAGSSPSAKERKQIAAQESFVEELRSMLEEVKRIAPLWNPTLDDGVVLTMAPLWRLVPQHKPWQRELRKRWGELCAGKYDWAHLAMHIWPERVVPKCGRDRSLAIAHGLEEVFWAEDEAGKRHQKDVSEAQLGQLVAQRASSAVKEVLEMLLPTQAPGGAPQGRVNRMPAR